MTSRESDSSIVLGGRESLLHGEGVNNSKGVSKNPSPGRNRPDKLMSSSLKQISIICQRDKKRRIRGLYTLLNKTNLKSAFYKLNKNSASGIDRQSFADYKANLDENLSELVDKLIAKRYRSKLIKRVYIPKSGGKKRPLGIPAISDKIIQQVVADILGAIYEVDFMDFSYGYRPGRNQHEAINHLQRDLYQSKGHVVEADVNSFFDNMNHDWLIRMLEQRINDRAFIRLIRKWLKVGVVHSSGKVEKPTSGSPQGGIISPILANVYLHYCLDLWFEKRFKLKCKGKVSMVRFADDFVTCFQYQEDAVAFMTDLPNRLAKFSLNLNLSKTRQVKFSRFALGRKAKLERFDFLGFEFRWKRTSQGKAVISTQTAKGKLFQTFANIKDWIKQNRHNRLRNLFNRLSQKLQGYYNYYSVRGNYRRVNLVHRYVRKILFKWLNRRGGRRSFNWKTFCEVLDFYKMKAPQIIHPCFGRRVILS